MKSKIIKNIGIAVISLSSFLAGSVQAEVLIGDLQIIVNQNLKEKSKYTGKLDLYDEDVDKVRNLKLIKLADEFKSTDGGYVVSGEYRDFSSGDIVTVDTHLVEKDDVIKVQNLDIVEVKKATIEAPEGEKKDFTDEEVKVAIQAYVEKQSKFTNYYGLVDPKTESLRKLTLIKLDEKVRKFGILNINTVEFKDQETDETLMVDVTMESKSGKLKVKSTKIKSIK